MKIESGLYIVGTPIGNLSDISFRAIDTLRSVDFVFAEDTMHTKKLFSRYEISTPLISCHKFNETRKSKEIIAKINNDFTNDVKSWNNEIIFFIIFLSLGLVTL